MGDGRELSWRAGEGWEISQGHVFGELRAFGRCINGMGFRKVDSGRRFIDTEILDTVEVSWGRNYIRGASGACYRWW